MPSHKRYIIAAILLFAAGAPVAADPTFQGLGFPSNVPGGGVPGSRALGMSPDGATVVGGATLIRVGRPVEWFTTWTQTQGTSWVGNPKSAIGPLNAAAISSAGTIVGCYSTFGSAGQFGFGPAEAVQHGPLFAISPDGQFMVGGSFQNSLSGAFRWSALHGFEVLGGGPSSVATGVSADGNLIVGGDRDITFSHFHGFAWTPAAGFVLVDGLPGAPNPDSYLLAVSADGSIAVGSASNASGLHQPVRWLPGRGLRIINNLAGTTHGTALAVSANGSVIVGYGGDPETGIPTPEPARAFVWDRVRGTRDLKTYLLQLGSAEVSLWTLSSATAISADGRTIAGSGTNPQGEHEAFIAHIPAFCYANCDISTIPPVLTVNDFTCFLNRFVAGDPYANCDDSTVAPVLNTSDFICFLNKYAAGCP